MKSLVGEIVAAVARRAPAEPPVPYTGTRNSLNALFGGQSGGDAQQNMAAMGRHGTLFAIVNLTSTAVASLTWRLYRKAKSGNPDDRTEVTSHAALDTWNTPNDFYTRQELLETCQQHLDLTGECWLVVATDPRMAGVPLGLWPIRPDKITPVPSAENYLDGYLYRGPDGQDYGLTRDQVMSIRMPSPLDPYRGMGPVGSVLLDAESSLAARMYNKVFFTNGAEPGGMLSVEGRLDDTQYDEIQARWQQAHRGTNNAHRVGVLEGMTWVDKKYTHEDMQFAELINGASDAIRTAFAIHPHMLGQADDVNLANATAAEITFARRQTIQRADRWKGMLNNDYLPKFYGGNRAAVDVEWDYDNPVAEDEASDAEIFYNRARGAQMLVLAGFHGEDVATEAGLPGMRWDPQSVTRSNSTLAAQESAGGGRPAADESNWENRLDGRRLRAVGGADPKA